MDNTGISRGQALVCVGLVLTVVGILSGFMPVSNACGSAFSGGNSFLTGAACDVLRSEASRSAVQMIVGGILLMLSVIVYEGFVGNQKQPRRGVSGGAGPDGPDWP